MGDESLRYEKVSEGKTLNACAIVGCITQICNFEKFLFLLVCMHINVDGNWMSFMNLRDFLLNKSVICLAGWEVLTTPYLLRRRSTGLRLD